MNNSYEDDYRNTSLVISSYASAVGKKESEGPLKDSFDLIIPDCYAGQKTFEQAESEFMNSAVRSAMGKIGLNDADIDIAFCGDLLNQCVASSFAMKSFAIPYAGIYGACSTMGLGLIMAGAAVDSGAANRALCAASSHYCTAERQYRMPLEYGSQRPPTAQWTVTASGACIIGLNNRKTNESSVENRSMCPSRDQTVQQTDKRGKKSNQTAEALPKDVYLDSALVGRIVDYSITDQNNMGAAMAPAAADTIYRYFKGSGTGPCDYDMIFTGDLGRIGSRLLRDLLLEKGIDLGERHNDCGVLIFDEKQDVHAGGSGCGCCASVLCGHILNAVRAGKYRNILFVPTGALLSPTTVMQKQTIPSIAHLVNIRI